MARGATEEAHDRRIDDIIAAIQKTGKALFAGTTLAQPPRHARQCRQLANV
jgi:hypothetical protein